MHSVMRMNLGELTHRGIEIFAASISLSTFRDQIYYELISAQNSNQKLFLRTVSKKYHENTKLCFYFRMLLWYQNLRSASFSYHILLYYYFHKKINIIMMCFIAN